MEVAAAVLPAALSDHIGLPAFLDKEKKTVDQFVAAGRRSNGFCFIQEEEEEDEEEDDAAADDSTESSSIGAESLSGDNDDRGEDDGKDEAQSKLNLDSLEDSLPIKRGLSNYFTGKSKSFQSLSEVGAAECAADLAKAENPFNKRRRILMACKNSNSWTRRASCSSLLPPLPPLAAVEDEDEEEDDDEDEEDTIAGGAAFPPLPHNFSNRKEEDRGVRKNFRSPRSFSLSDLQHG